LCNSFTKKIDKVRPDTSIDKVRPDTPIAIVQRILLRFVYTFKII